MRAKQSVLDAKERARSLSLHPNNKGVIVYVLDKPYQRAKVFTIEFLVRDWLLDDWQVVCRYRDGKELA